MDLLARQATPTDTPPSEPVADEEFYSSWSLFLVCVLLIISLWTSYYLQIKRIRAVHETLVSIAAGMFVGFVVRLAPGQMIREMLVRFQWLSIMRTNTNAMRRLFTIPSSSTYSYLLSS